ncbi:hypothetical protein BDD12DRAFT_265407 [Trichophaea hybrida]|nr:hypothetical protein BDD12DRAFT_265407 [Trichophaea hybrida]
MDFPPITVISPSGDLLLHVSPKKFQVSSQRLMQASPVFRAMLAPGRFKEGSNFAKHVAAKPFMLSLQDDDPAAMEIILRAIHTSTRFIPMYIPLRVLSQLVVVWDKYDFALKWGGNTLRLAVDGDDEVRRRAEIQREKIRLFVRWVKEDPVKDVRRVAEYQKLKLRS